MLEKIRESCEYVSLNSKYVSINYKELDNFIKNIRQRDNVFRTYKINIREVKKMDYNIRKKWKKRDCMSVAHVITIAWNETYKGIIDDDILNNLYSNEDERANNSLKNFDTNEDEQLVLEVDNKVVGFANVGKPNDTTYNNCGELFAIYIMGKYKGKRLW
ncbi:MAG: GNAT family N-acetyltransferase [Clostridium sp.]|nr:MAG: GNAT family N-acetyltransferase [Clostridium sp.]